MTTFKKFPLSMHHPDHQAAAWEKLPDRGNSMFLKGDTKMISPERFPPVTVMNEHEQNQWAAKGYRCSNQLNASDFERALIEQSNPENYEFQAFPKYKYHPFELPVICQDAKQEAALGEGWFDHPVEATAEDEANSYQSVRQEAEEHETPAQKIDKRTKEYKATLTA